MYKTGGFFFFFLSSFFFPSPPTFSLYIFRLRCGNPPSSLQLHICPHPHAPPPSKSIHICTTRRIYVVDSVGTMGRKLLCWPYTPSVFLISLIVKVVSPLGDRERSSEEWGGQGRQSYPGLSPVVACYFLVFVMRYSNLSELCDNLMFKPEGKHSNTKKIACVVNDAIASQNCWNGASLFLASLRRQHFATTLKSYSPACHKSSTSGRSTT